MDLYRRGSELNENERSVERKKDDRHIYRSVARSPFLTLILRDETEMICWSRLWQKNNQTRKDYAESDASEKEANTSTDRMKNNVQYVSKLCTIDQNV